MAKAEPKKPGRPVLPPEQAQTAMIQGLTAQQTLKGVMTMEQPQDDVSAAGGQSRSTAGLDMRQPQEMLVAVAPRRDVAPDDAVWLNIYCSVANCSNTEKHHAVEWADAGLAEFKKRFTR